MILANLDSSLASFLAVGVTRGFVRIDEACFADGTKIRRQVPPISQANASLVVAE